MKKLTPEFLTSYFEVKETIENRALEVASLFRNNDLRISTTFTGGMETIDIDEERVDIKFSESWAYGGYDSYSIAFPTRNLYLSDEEILSELEPTNNEIIERRKANEIINKKREHEDDLKKFKELKVKLKQS